METVFKKMNEAIDAADREAHATTRAAVKGLARKDCSRCGGKGYDYFLGGSCAPGVCFKCGGSGWVYAGADKGVAAKRTLAIELVRLRACWAAVRDALAEAKAGTVTGWAARSGVRDLERKLVSYEKAGKDLAAEIEGKAKHAS